MDTARRWLAGIRRCLALAGLLTLAYLVVFFCWLARIKLPNVPAQRLAPTLLAMLWDWLAGIKWRIVPAGALLLAVMAASAGSTQGDSHISLSASPSSMEISPGETKTYSLELHGNPVDNNKVDCGDYLVVHVSSGSFLVHLDIEYHSFGYDTDPNGDKNCDDHGWGSGGNSTSVTVSGDAPGNTRMGIAYEVRNWSKNHRPRVLSPKTLLRIRVTGVVPPTPTPTPTPRPPDPPPDNNDQSQDNNNQPQDNNNQPQDNNYQPQDNNDQSQDNNNPPQNSGSVPGTAPSAGGGGGGGGGGGSGSGARSTDGCASRPPDGSSVRNLIGSTSAAMAYEMPGDRLWIERLDIPGTTIELGIGWFASDASARVVVGIIRDETYGQTYYIARHEGGNCIVRRWIPSYDLIVYHIPWAVVNTEYSVPVEVVSAIPLDHTAPEPNMLVRRFDSDDVRIFAFDPGLLQWRHIPNYATFQAMGFFWCDVTSADASFFKRMNEGPPFPVIDTPERGDYPNCHNREPVDY